MLLDSFRPHPSFPIFAALALSIGAVQELCAQGSEYQAKPERIYSLARFVELPASRFSEPHSPLVIGLFGTDSISGFLREELRDRRKKDRPVVVRHIVTKEQLSACHVLFISRSERDRLPTILNAVRRAGVLTVGETENFLQRGGIINPENFNGDIRFQVNLTAARRERLPISSKLLQLSIRENRDALAAGVAGYFSNGRVK